MTMTDAPGIRTDNAILILAREIGRLADAMDHLAVASQAFRVPAQAAPGPAGPRAGASGPPGQLSGPSVEEKMGKKVFAICKGQGWDIADIGQRATGRDIGGDSRKWTRADLAKVLDTLKEWGHG